MMSVIKSTQYTCHKNEKKNVFKIKEHLVINGKVISTKTIFKNLTPRKADNYMYRIKRGENPKTFK